MLGVPGPQSLEKSDDLWSSRPDSDCGPGYLVAFMISGRKNLKSLQIVTEATKLKDVCSLEEKL